MPVLSPICAFDVSPDGIAAPIKDPWPKASGAGEYRWLHLDITAPETKIWCAENLPDAATVALTLPETRPRATLHDDGLILTLRGINLNENSVPEDMVSVRIFVTPDYVITARARKIFAIDDLRARFMAGKPTTNVSSFLAALTEGLTNRIEQLTLLLEDQTDALEDDSNAAAQTAQLAALRQQVIKLRRFIGPQKDALAALSRSTATNPSKRVQERFAESANTAARSTEALDAIRDRLAALQDQAETEIAKRLARNNYLFSIVAVIFLPLGFFTGLFGVNLGGMPGIDAPIAFAILCLVLVLIGGGLALLLKIWKWY